MTKKAFPILTGGLNEVVPPDLIDDSQLQVCTNYEIVGDGVLRKRKGITLHEASDEMGSIEKIFDPYYPITLLEDQTNDYLLFVYTGSELHAYYDTGDEWVNTFDGYTLNDILTDAGVVYTSDSDIQITIGSDKVIIADGVNPVHFVSVDKDGELRAGVMGIPAPTNKATVTEMTEWQSDLWETDSTASRLSTPGLFQCVYTVVTKYGEESNPSPLSNTLDMQFFKLDADGIDERWLEKVEIGDLSVPDVSQNVLDDLKYFKVYMRVIKYSEGEGTSQLEFTQQFEITNKDSATSGTTGNNYTLTVEVSPGEIASYENDVAPIAKTAAEVGGIIMAGNVKTKISFPWNFKYYHPIMLNNIDSKTYVDAVIRVRLTMLDLETQYFDIDSFIGEENKFINPEYFRIFDEDMTTPLAICHDHTIQTDRAWIDLYIKVPILTAASPRTIYVCWTNPSVAITAQVSGVAITNAGFGYGDGYVPLTFDGGGGTGADGYATVVDSSVNSITLTNGGSGYTSSPTVSIDEEPQDSTVGVESVEITEPGAGYPPDTLSLIFTGGGGAGAAGYALIRSTKVSFVVLTSGGSGYTSAPSVVLDIEPEEVETEAYLTATIADGAVEAIECTLSATIGSTTLDHEAVVPTIYNEYSYGKVFRVGVDIWSDQKTWSGGRVANSTNTVFADFEMGYINKAGESDDDIITGTSIETSFFKMPATGQYLPGSRYLSIENDVDRVEFKPPHYIDASVPDRGAVSFYYRLGSTPYHYQEAVMSIFSKTLSYFPEDGEFAGVGIGASAAPPSSDSGHFILFSWEGDDDRSLFVISLETGEMNRMEMTDFNSEDTSTFTSLIIGYMEDAKYDNVSYRHGRYFSADNTDDIAAVKNMANLMPAFNNMIGYDYTDHNNNITFDETKEIEYKEYKNMVKWTDVNYQSFPDLFYKQVKEPILRIIPAPSFLQFEYQNTFIIFTRNSINRFVLEGSADGWSGSVSSLIEEKTQYGLLAPESLVRAGDALFWLSEVGVVMWGREGMGLISKNVVNVPIKDSLIGFYAPLKNQYIIHDNTGYDSSETQTYVYHIDKNAWTKFSHLDITSATTMTGGAEMDNVNLFTNESTGGVYEYPSTDYIDSTTIIAPVGSTIETKELYLDKGVLRKMKLDYDGGSDVTMKSTATTESLLGVEKENTNIILSPTADHWRGIALKNSRGKRLTFGVTNAEEIYSIMYDVKLEE